MISPKRLELPWQEPQALARQLVHIYGEQGLIWLDGDGSDLGRWATLAVNPQETICCRGLPGDPDATDPFAALRGLSPGHWCGWLSYEAAAWVEPGNPWASDGMATLWITRHDPVLRFDLQHRKVWIEATTTEALQTLSETLSQPAPPSTKQVKGIPLGAWHHHTPVPTFAACVKRIQNLIAAGDLFQANLTACCSTPWPPGTSSIDLFLKLRRACPAPFAGLMITGHEEALLSASPERFLQVNRNGVVQTRPIKGTRPRHSLPERDAELAAELVSSDKDRAENVMIVDLLRNDLGRVCQPGSIRVPQLVGLESYSAVHHLTSVVEGQLQDGLNWVDLLKACWPGGSISGAPKLRACQRLHALEPTSRGPYCGSILRIDWDGTFDSNILIRSVLREGDTLRAHAGCGIVADSNPDSEAEELMWKMQPLLEALS